MTIECGFLCYDLQIYAFLFDLQQTTNRVILKRHANLSLCRNNNNNKVSCSQKDPACMVNRCQCCFLLAYAPRSSTLSDYWMMLPFLQMEILYTKLRTR